MFAVPSFFGYNTTFVSTPVATAATGVGETSFTANWNAFAGASYYLLDVSTSSTFSSFVGSYQDFVVITNSQVVSGLTANTTYYYRLRAATGVDADAASFFSRVYTAGGALSYTEVSATETLVASLKANSLWTPMKAVYPMVGSSAAACAQNLKSSSFTGTFSSGWTFASTGVTGNGTSAYMDTFMTNSTLINTNCSWGFYSRTNSAGLYADIGLGPAEVLTNLGGVLYCDMPNSGFRFTVSNNDSRGFYNMCNDSTNGLKIYKNGTNIGSSSFKNADFVAQYNMLVGAYEEGAKGRFTNRELALAYAANSINSTQASDFYTAVQAFQTTLSRNV